MSAVLSPEGKPLDTLKLEAEIGKLIAESGKLQAEQAKFNAEQAKLYAEGLKLTRERILYPIIAAATAAGAAIGVGTLVLKALGH